MVIAAVSLLSGMFCSATSPAPLHGVWITNVASNSMRSKGDVAETIAICRRNGVNAVFIVVWNNGLTTYPSTVLERYIGVKQSPVYKGFDPLGEFVRQGHQAGIKVHAWFEYGFSHHYGADEDVWAKKYPEWNGRTIDGKNLVKNGFAWWNALDLRPQKFLREIVLEVVQKYDIDGVQGDDRMPALPAEGGYDEQTLAAFHHETGSLGKPEKEDKTWIQWRCDRLSSFARAIYEDVKKAKKDCLVSWAPSIYPWSKDEYLQDWPTWLRSGCADFVVPQVYRYNAADYDATLSELRGQLSESDMHRVFPGMLTALGSGYRATPSFLAHMKQSNSRLGFKGECLFYFESLRHSGERACQAHFPMQKS